MPISQIAGVVSTPTRDLCQVAQTVSIGRRPGAQELPNRTGAATMDTRRITATYRSGRNRGRDRGWSTPATQPAVDARTTSSGWKSTWRGSASSSRSTAVAPISALGWRMLDSGTTVAVANAMSS